MQYPFLPFPHPAGGETTAHAEAPLWPEQPVSPAPPSRGASRWLFPVWKLGSTDQQHRQHYGHSNHPPTQASGVVVLRYGKRQRRKPICKDFIRVPWRSLRVPLLLESPRSPGRKCFLQSLQSQGVSEVRRLTQRV